jgi:hypothetical protein
MLKILFLFVFAADLCCLLPLISELCPELLKVTERENAYTKKAIRAHRDGRMAQI